MKKINIVFSALNIPSEWTFDSTKMQCNNCLQWNNTMLKNIKDFLLTIILQKKLKNVTYILGTDFMKFEGKEFTWQFGFTAKRVHHHAKIPYRHEWNENKITELLNYSYTRYIFVLKQPTVYLIFTASWR